MGWVVGDDLVLVCGWFSVYQHSSLLFIIKGKEMGKDELRSRHRGAVVFPLLPVDWGR